MAKIEISDELYQKIIEKIKNLPEYKSPEDYIMKILEKDLQSLAYSKEEEEQIKKRLGGLGYLD